MSSSSSVPMNTSPDSPRINSRSAELQTSQVNAMPLLPRREFLRYSAAALTIAPFTFDPRATAAEPAKQKKKIRIGQIGTTHPHASKLDVYRRSPDYEVVGIVEPDPALREAASQKAPFRDLTWMTREQLLNLPDLDAVLVETEVRDLLDNAELCLAAGKHIHLDKPAGSSFPHFKRIVEIAESRHLMIQLGYMYRYNPGFLLLQEFLHKGLLGEVFEVHAVMSKVVPPAQRKQLSEFSGGMMFELGCHVIDSILWLFGVPDKVTPFPRHSLASAQDNLADNMLAVLEYPRATITVRTSAMEVDGGARRHLAVCGTGGTMHIEPLDDPAAVLTFAAPHEGYKQGRQSIQFPKFSRYVADAADMAAVIRGEKITSFDLSHDLAVQKTILQAAAMPLDT